MRERRPIRLVQLHTVQRVFRLAKDLGQARPPVLVFQVPNRPPLDEQLDEAVYIRVFGEQRPVEPACIVVLAIRVVVALLTAPHLIAHQQTSAHLRTAG